MPRATKVERDKRIEQVCQLLIQGAQRRDVINWALGRWSVGERQVDKYIHAAHEYIAQRLPTDHTYEVALSLARHTLVWGQANRRASSPWPIRPSMRSTCCATCVPTAIRRPSSIPPPCARTWRRSPPSPQGRRTR